MTVPKLRIRSVPNLITHDIYHNSSTFLNRSNSKLPRVMTVPKFRFRSVPNLIVVPNLITHDIYHNSNTFSFNGIPYWWNLDVRNLFCTGKILEKYWENICGKILICHEDSRCSYANTFLAFLKPFFELRLSSLVFRNAAFQHQNRCAP